MISYGNDPDGQPDLTAGRSRKGRRMSLLSRKPSQTDTALYIAGWLLILAALTVSLLLKRAPETAARLRWPFPCPFDSLLHIPCLGCGATRALRALAHGKLLESLGWHPAVAFFAAEAAAFLLSQTAGRLSRGRIRMLTYNDIYIYALLAVILLQWTVKLLIGWRP